MRFTRFRLQVDLKPLREATVAVPAPKITEKRKAEDADASKDLKKVNIFGLFAPPCLRSDLIDYSCEGHRESGSLLNWGRNGVQGYYRITSYSIRVTSVFNILGPRGAFLVGTSISRRWLAVCCLARRNRFSDSRFQGFLFTPTDDYDASLFPSFHMLRESNRRAVYRVIEDHRAILAAATRRVVRLRR